jgi:carboxyl-terminal processing protease
MRSSRVRALALRAIPYLLWTLATASGGASFGQAQPVAAAEGATQIAPTPGAEQQLDTVQRAFDLLEDRSVHPLGPAILLRAAWEQLAEEASEQQAPPPGPTPTFDDDRAAAFATFRAALQRYLDGAASWPEAFVPAHAAVHGMVRAVDEQHTYFLSPRQYQERLAWSTGAVTFGGIGLRFQSPGLLVLDVDQGAPAERAGLQPGDRILRIDEVDATDLPAQQATDLLRGPIGTTVELVVQPRDGGPQQMLHLEREQIRIDPVVPRLLGTDIGYIRLRAFPEPSVVDAFERALADFEARGVHGLVLDLRDNAGGRLDLGRHLLSDFLPPGTSLYQVLDRAGDERTAVAEARAHHAGLPLVLLVDDRTASMGEIFAAALHEHGVASLVGTRTAGNVARGDLFPLGDGSALNVTTSDILSSAGAPLNKVGVEPDDLVEGNRATSADGRDPPLERALALLGAGAQQPPTAP